MKKGELTRLNIIQKFATIFNQKGYMTTTMSDSMFLNRIHKPRKCISFGTANNYEFLVDDPGERRGLQYMKI